MASVVRGDGAVTASSPLTRYYTESGTPAGRFFGAGLAGLDDGRGVPAGSVVTEEHLFRMLGKLQDPITGAPLGRLPQSCAAAYIDSRGGTRKVPRPVAGFDLTFSAPKSVSVAWALGDAATQAAVYAAHLRALEHVIGYAEREIFTSRSGKAGVVQEDIRGVVAAAFDHWDSRAGDPQLHTHVVVMNRAQSTDGTWRTLDGRVLFRATVALSEMYNAVLSDYLTAELGWGWEPAARRHSAVPKYEVAGVGDALRAEFSQRSAAIEGAKDDLVTRFAAAHGRQPSDREVLKLRQQATLSTRPAKEGHPLADQMSVWRSRASDVLGTDPVAWVSTLAGRNDLPLLHAGDLGDPMLADVAGVALATVAGKRATFSRLNVFAEVLRQLHGVRFATAEERMAVVERTTGLALGQAVLVSAPELAHTPAAFRRPDGSSRFRAKGFETYTTRDTLDAEARLLDAGRCMDGPAVSGGLAAFVARQPLRGRDHTLSADQARAVQQVITSGRVVDLLVGAAGTGKSTTMAGVRAAWEERYGPGSVVGLAPSAAAAEVLSQVVGIPTENTAKWLVENDRNTTRAAQVEELRARLWRASPSRRTQALRTQLHRVVEEGRRWSLRPGRLVIVDEASMAGTFDLDTLTAQARLAGAKVLLVGDWAQLSPVAAGGAFSLLVHDRGDVPELSDVRRFRHEWERDASLALRAGEIESVEAYDGHGRVRGGDREAMLDVLYAGWRADIRAGRRSLMIANDGDTVDELNARARADRVAAGQVSSDGIPIADQAVAGVGDLVVTRRNDRALSAGRGWVKNGDAWTITGIDRHGAVTVRRAGGGGSALLPPEYVREHVELGYATTAYRAQGRTVDTAHAFVSATTQREPLYVMATRGRESNRLYVDTAYDPDPDTAHAAPESTRPVDALRQVLANVGAEKSATRTIADEWADAHSVGRLMAEYRTIARVAAEDRYGTLVSDCLTSAGLEAHVVHAMPASRAYGPLMLALFNAETQGLDVRKALPRLVEGRTLVGVDDVTAVLHGRVSRWASASLDTGRSGNRELLAKPVQVDDPDVQRALDDRTALMEHRTRRLEDAVQQQPTRRTVGYPRQTVHLEM